MSEIKINLKWKSYLDPQSVPVGCKHVKVEYLLYFKLCHFLLLLFFFL